MENRYDVVLDVLDKRITVNIFTKDKVTPAELKELSIQRGIEFMAEFGEQVTPEQFKPVGYVDRGAFGGRYNAINYKTKSIKTY